MKQDFIDQIANQSSLVQFLCWFGFKNWPPFRIFSSSMHHLPRKSPARPSKIHPPGGPVVFSVINP